MENGEGGAEARLNIPEDFRPQVRSSARSDIVADLNGCQTSAPDTLAKRRWVTPTTPAPHHQLLGIDAHRHTHTCACARQHTQRQLPCHLRLSKTFSLLPPFEHDSAVRQQKHSTPKRSPLFDLQRPSPFSRLSSMTLPRGKRRSPHLSAILPVATNKDRLPPSREKYC